MEIVCTFIFCYFFTPKKSDSNVRKCSKIVAYGLIFQFMKKKIDIFAKFATLK